MQPDQPSNDFDGLSLDKRGFAFLDLLGQDRWTAWTPVFGSLTVVGATSYTGRYRIVGRSCEFQVQFSAATSIASTAGTDYLNLPFTAAGLAGIGIMQNITTNVSVGNCTINVAQSKCFLPAQAASGNTFTIKGDFEI